MKKVTNNLEQVGELLKEEPKRVRVEVKKKSVESSKQEPRNRVKEIKGGLKAFR